MATSTGTSNLNHGGAGGRVLVSVALLVALVLTNLVGASDAAASHLEEADPVADNAFVGDALRGIGVGALGAVFERAADSAEGMASTTKAWTILLAVEAVQAEDIALDSPVTISQNALSINQSQNHNHGTICTDGNTNPPDCAPGTQLEVGDQFLLEDALRMLYIRSPGDLTIAVAEAVAGSETAFVQRMNDRAAEIGLTQTVFFNSYGADHSHDAEGNSTGAVPHQTTPREMATWFLYAMENPLFREIMGFRGTYTFQNISGTKSYSFRFNPSNPGIQAQKGGRNGACGRCWIGEAERIGREIVVAIQRSGERNTDPSPLPGDVQMLLDAGFAQTFHPQQQAVAPPWGLVDDASVACLSPGRVASAVVTPGGSHRLLVWYANLDAGGLALLGATPASGGGMAAGTAQGVDTADAGGGNVIVAVDRTDGQMLVAYGVTPQGHPFLRDTVKVGAGSDVAVEALASGLLATAHRDSSGGLVFSTWGFDLASGTFSSEPLDSTSHPGVGQFAFAAGQTPGERRAVLAAEMPFDLAQVRGWSVAVDGTITSSAIRTWTGHTSHISLTSLPGFDDDFDGLYAMASRSGTDEVRLQLIRFGSDNFLAGVGDPGTTGIQVGPQGTTAVAAYEKGGVLVASKGHQSSAVTDLSTWSIDPEYSDLQPNQVNRLAPNLVVSESAGPADRLFDMCRLPDDRAEGDFVLLQQDLFNSEVRPEGWRSAPRAPREANLEHLGVSLIDPPAEIEVNTPVELLVRHVVRNNGPTFAADVRLDTLVSAPDDCLLQPKLSFQPVLGLSETQVVDTRVRLICSEPSFHPIQVQAWIAPASGLIDPHLDNNSASTNTTIEVIARADLAVLSLDLAALDQAGPSDLLVGERFEFASALTLHNFGDTLGDLYHSPVEAKVSRTIEVPEGLRAFVQVSDAEGPATVLVDDGQHPIAALDQPAGATVEVEGPVRITVGFDVDALEPGADQVVDTIFGVRCQQPGTHDVRFRADVSPADEHVVDPAFANNRWKTGRTIECGTPVQINIRPGNKHNVVNANSNQSVPVAILTTDEGEYGLPLAFDATAIDPASARFGTAQTLDAGGGSTPSLNHVSVQDSFEMDDTTKDGDLDMALRFKVPGTGIDQGTTEACLTGTYLGPGDIVLTFFGCDFVEVRP